MYFIRGYLWKRLHAHELSSAPLKRRRVSSLAVKSSAFAPRSSLPSLIYPAFLPSPLISKLLFLLLLRLPLACSHFLDVGTKQRLVARQCHLLRRLASQTSLLVDPDYLTSLSVVWPRSCSCTPLSHRLLFFQTAQKA